MHRTADCIGGMFVFATLTLTTPVFAQGYAVRAGANVNPDQLSGGIQYAFSPIGENLRPTPSVDLGLGNDATLVAINLDLLLHSRPLGDRSRWTARVGGGPALNHYRLPLYTQTGAGINLVTALAHTSGWFSEVRVGFLDSPAVRFGAGFQWTPRSRPSRPGRR